MFCKHQWETISKTYNPGIPVAELEKSGVNSKNLSKQLAEYLNGFTNIQQKCKKCGKVEVIKVIGKVEDPFVKCICRRSKR